MAREHTTSTNRRARLQSARTNDNTYHLDQTPASKERHRRIAEAAYLIAERRGFQGGSALEDWLAAEAQIDGRSAQVSTTTHSQSHN